MTRQGTGVSDPRVVSFARMLKQLRVAAGFTQEELAEASGVATRSISDLERGVNRTARKDTTRLLADALRIDGQVRAAFEAAARGRAIGHGGLVLLTATDGVAAGTRTLPRDVASFIGRDAELQQLVDAVTAGTARADGVVSVWTIGGMAGIGKTAFAIHAGHRLADRYQDGQIFLSLHAHTPGQEPVEPADALVSLLQMVGVVASRIPVGLAARTQMWREHVAGKRLLLVFDDASGHDQVRPLIPGTSGSLVLVTSRRHLTALEDAQAISLEALTADEGGTLLVRLAARPSLAGDDADVAEITRLAGCLPLAIGMLARQLHHHPVWTVAGLVSDLAAARDRLALMRAENISVAAAFDLSYRDLSAAQQRLFRRLGLHPGLDIDSYAAAALDATDHETALQHLNGLYDHYLITETASGRYELHDLLREHARALAAADPMAERTAATGRLLAYYLRTARQADRFLARRAPAKASSFDVAAPAHAPRLVSRDDAVSWMESERLNLQAAAGYAAAHDQPAYSAAVAAAMHGFLRNQGHWSQARILHRAALDAARHASDRLAEAGALTDLGTFQLDTGDYMSAIASHERALELHSELGNKLGEANALNHLGDALRVTRDYQSAAARYCSALELHNELGNKLGEANAHRGLGAVSKATGDYRAAARRFELALRLFRDLGNPAGEARVLNHIGSLAQATDAPSDALARYEQALAIASRIGSLPEKARAAEGVAQFHLKAGDIDLGLSYLWQALEIYQQLGSFNAERVQRAIDSVQSA